MAHWAWAGALVGTWLVAQTVPPTGQGPKVLTIDAGDSRVTILVGKAGVLSFAGHAHEIETSAVRRRVRFDAADWPHASVSLEFGAAALRVTGKGEPASDVPAVERTMLGEQVLDVRRFPTITFQSRRVSAAFRGAREATLTIDGDLTVRGTTRPMTVRAETTIDASGRVTATGAFTLKQSEFGITPVTAAGGTIRVRDRIDIRFVLTAIPASGTTGSR
jgi:polyisoprenoid-binding protein YceI